MKSLTEIKLSGLRKIKLKIKIFKGFLPELNVYAVIVNLVHDAARPIHPLKHECNICVDCL